ncbi:PREDICTED: uncharacterized protein LOC106804878 [Priapulus caudatus]|uniref:Uncharacterized protein LOC106804878 n=1 Tax=Priapulus caudatus TaxID=37621 RepID=A0ABM1DP73_PRICU|nr:PREDICTED: uncharacterized protein LOC106804878 [Priapulus caudatus]XP_014661744.1 PREDICTED: uncharacterized protein LOC106804878 [Priapulus caudatus]
MRRLLCIVSTKNDRAFEQLVCAIERVDCNHHSALPIIVQQLRQKDCLQRTGIKDLVHVSDAEAITVGHGNLKSSTTSPTIEEPLEQSRLSTDSLVRQQGLLPASESDEMAAMAMPNISREAEPQDLGTAENWEGSDSDSDEDCYWPSPLVNLRSPINILAPMFWCTDNRKVLEDFLDKKMKRDVQKSDAVASGMSVSVAAQQSCAAAAAAGGEAASCDVSMLSEARCFSIVLSPAAIDTMKELRDFEMTELAALTSRLAFSKEDRTNLEQLQNMYSVPCFVKHCLQSMQLSVWDVMEALNHSLVGREDIAAAFSTLVASAAQQ